MTCSISFCLRDALMDPWNVCMYVRTYVCACMHVRMNVCMYVAYTRTLAYTMNTPPRPLHTLANDWFWRRSQPIACSFEVLQFCSYTVLLFLQFYSFTVLEFYSFAHTLASTTHRRQRARHNTQCAASCMDLFLAATCVWRTRCAHESSSMLFLSDGTVR